jgi:RHS repeat-associated protein
LNYRTNNGSTEAFTVDGLNQLGTVQNVGNFSYDGNGNLITVEDFIAYQWDDENRLVDWYYGTVASGAAPEEGDQWVEFKYDGLGRLRQRVEHFYDGTTWDVMKFVNYIYDGMRVIQERAQNNTPTVSYTRGSDLSGTLEGAGGIGGLLARSHGYSGGNWSTHNYYHSDGNGNITYLVTSAQGLAASYRYDPFGNIIAQSGTLSEDNVYRFSSKEYVPTTGEYYYGYRWYDPYLQRWLNRDPLGETGFESMRQKRGVGQTEFSEIEEGPNSFCFVVNDPIGLIDPDGEGWQPGGLGGGRLKNDTAQPITVLIGGNYFTLNPGKSTRAIIDDVDGYWMGGVFYPVDGGWGSVGTHKASKPKGRRWKPGDVRGTPNSPMGRGAPHDHAPPKQPGPTPPYPPAP